MVIRLGNGKPVLSQDETDALVLFLTALNQWFARHPRLLELDERGQALFELSRAWSEQLLDAPKPVVMVSENKATPVNTPVDS